MDDRQRLMLQYAAQQVCLALTEVEYRALGERARVALVQLALAAGSTDVSWWPAWVGREEARARLLESTGGGRCAVCGCPLGSADCQRAHP